MARCIVCAIDDTSAARPTAAIAARLARHLDSTALLVHVTAASGALQRIVLPGTTRRRRMRRSIAVLADENAFPRSTRVRVLAGEPAQVLMDHAEREDAELIVAGAGGQSTASDLILGRVTTQLMREAPCPVIVVPADTVAPLDSDGMRAIVCGVAGEEADRSALWLATDLAARLGGQVHAVFAYGTSTLGEATESEPELREAAEQRLAEILQEAGVGPTPHVIPLPGAEALQRVAKHHGAGMIVLASPAGGGATERGSLPTQVAAAGRNPVVVIPPRARLEHGSGHYELVTAAA